MVWVRKEQRQYALDPQLIEALVKSDTKQAIELVNAEADPNTRYKPTPAPSLPELMNQLLHHSTLPTNDSPTALMLACGVESDVNKTETLSQQQNAFAVVRAMLMHDAQVNLVSHDKDTSLMGAVCMNRIQIVERLLQQGADANVQDSYGITNLMLAASNRNTSIVQMLLDHGANVNSQDVLGYTALVYAVSPNGNIKITQRLLLAGANPYLISRASGKSAFKFAEEDHRPDIVALLRKYSKHP